MWQWRKRMCSDYWALYCISLQCRKGKSKIIINSFVAPKQRIPKKLKWKFWRVPYLIPFFWPWEAQNSFCFWDCMSGRPSPGPRLTVFCNGDISGEIFQNGFWSFHYNALISSAELHFDSSSWVSLKRLTFSVHGTISTSAVENMPRFALHLTLLNLLFLSGDFIFV